jgi:hypothetical protein
MHTIARTLTRLSPAILLVHFKRFPNLPPKAIIISTCVRNQDPEEEKRKTNLFIESVIRQHSHANHSQRFAHVQHRVMCLRLRRCRCETSGVGRLARISGYRYEAFWRMSACRQWNVMKQKMAYSTEDAAMGYLETQERGHE